MQIKLPFVVKVHVTTGCNRNAVHLPKTNDVCFGTSLSTKNCCSVKDLCIHSRENPLTKKAIIISKDNIGFYFPSTTEITLVQRTIFVFRTLLNNIAVN